MNVSRFIQGFLWIFPLLIQTTILSVLLTRKLWVRFPFFSAYTVSVLSRACILLFVPYPGRLYAVVYFCGEVLAIALGLGAIFETIRYLCAPYAFVRIAFRLIRIAIIIFSPLPILILLHATDREFAMLVTAERSARLVQACLLILVIFVVSQLGSTWSDYSVGIAAGFGIYSALSLAIFELSRLHLVSVPILVTFNSAAYNVAAIIWGIYFLRPSRGWRSAELPKPNLTQWREALTAYTQQWHRQ